MQTIQEPGRQLPVVHSTGGFGMEFESRANVPRRRGRFEDTIGSYPEFINGYSILILPPKGRYMQVPYWSMFPKRIKGLLVAGRSHGADRATRAATRNMACSAVMGQGAGTAAAQSLKSNQNLNELNLAPVHAELDRQGVRIH